MREIRRVIEDTSFQRFIKELIFFTTKHPDTILDSCWLGDDERAEGSFMFKTIICYKEES